MNKKSFEHIENKFRQAAENFQPPVTPEAWEKMELLLDKQRKKRRPVFWFWPLLLILVTGGAGVYLFRPAPQRDQFIAGTRTVAPSFNKPEKLNDQQQVSPTGNLPENKSKLKQQPSSTSVNTGQENVTSQVKKDNTIPPPGIQQDSRINLPVSPSQTGSRKNTGDQQPLGNVNRYPKTRQASTERNSTSRRYAPATGKNKNVSRKESRIKETAVETDSMPINDAAGKKSQLGNDKVTPDGKLADEPSKDTANAKVISSDKNLPDTMIAADKKIRKSTAAKPSRLYFTLSLAADGNALKALSVDQTAIRYGVGIGYMLNNRWSVQSGLYGSQKRYAAGANDYYFKPGSYYDTVNMKNIDAVCYVMDIPVSVRYNIMQKKQSLIYGVVGLSSYIMKKETYDYYYTYHNTWPSTPKKATRVYTGNKHLFSVLDISAGYERKLSRMISLQAEPYVNIPLGGVGEGKVHLYSAGLQVAFRWQYVKRIQEGSR